MFEKTVSEPTEVKLTPAQRNAEAIIAHLSEYLAIRFDHAARVNPLLAHMKADLLYHELSNVRRTLLGEKIYGPIRIMVGDVLLSDDDVKRRRIMSSADQTSIQVELVSHCQDEKVEATRGQIRFHDLKSFYAAVDPRLIDFIDLVETWIWWDIFDAVELVRFEQKLGRVAHVRQGQVSEELRRRYSLMIHPLTEPEQQVKPVTDEEILRYEYGQLHHIRDQWRFRHHGELGYKFVLKREVAEGLTEHAEENLGPPFNFKDRQLEKIERWLGDLKAQLPAAVTAAPAAPAATAAAAEFKESKPAAPAPAQAQTPAQPKAAEPQLPPLKAFEPAAAAKLSPAKPLESRAVDQKPAAKPAAKPFDSNEHEPDWPDVIPLSVLLDPSAPPASSPPASTAAIDTSALDDLDLSGSMSIAGTPGLNPGVELPPVDPKLGF